MLREALDGLVDGDHEVDVEVQRVQLCLERRERRRQVLGLPCAGRSMRLLEGARDADREPDHDGRQGDEQQAVDDAHGATRGSAGMRRSIQLASGDRMNANTQAITTMSRMSLK